MKNVLLILCVVLLYSCNTLGQSWNPNYKKTSFADSTRYSKDASFNGPLRMNSTIKIGGLTLSSSATELNLLDGALFRTKEANMLVGVDTTKTIQAQFVLKLNAADTVYLSNRINLKANLANPAFTGIAKVGTDTLATRAYSRSVGGTGGTIIATDTTSLSNRIDAKADLNSPSFTNSISTPTIILNGTTVNATPGEINHLTGVNNNIQTQLNTKAGLNNTIFTGTTQVQVLQIGASDSALSISAMENVGKGMRVTDIHGTQVSFDFPDSVMLDVREVAVMLENRDNFITAIHSLGSPLIAQPLTLTHYGNADIELNDGEMMLMLIWMPKLGTITGVNFMMEGAGAYTADGYNGVGIYSHSGGVWTLRASSTNDGNIWKTTAYTLGTKDFSSTYAAEAGPYLIAALYNTSSETDAPSIKGGAETTAAFATPYALTNSNKVNSILGSQSSLPATINASSLTGIQYTIGLFLR